MTSFNEATVRCSVCGEKSQHTILMSTNSHGQDLDTRPCGMARDTLGSELMVCPHCGYIAHSLDKPVSAAVRKYVLSPDYPKDIRPVSWFEGASVQSYRNLAEIALIDEKYAAAFFAILKAAWLCDDGYGNKEEAVTMRKRALELLALISPQDIEDDAKTLLTVDLYRRTGQFDKVIEISSNYAADSEVAAEQFKYEIELARDKDDKAHRMRMPRSRIT